MASTSPLSRLSEQAPSLTRQEHKITSIDGTEISLWRIASSANPEGMPQPALIYIHGGAFIFRNIDISTVDLATFNDHLIHRLGPDSLDPRGCVILYVSYRLATKSPFPAPVEDVGAAYEYALQHADDLGILSDKICLVGVRAGGNLAWAAVHMALDKGLPAPCGLVAISPMLDPDATWDKHRAPIRLEARDNLRRGWETYLVRLSDVPKPLQKYARLLQLSREDLAKLPPVYMDVGTEDCFAVEVLQAMEMLKGADVELDTQVVKGMEQSFEIPLYKKDPANKTLQRVWEARRSFLRKVHTSGQGGSRRRSRLSAPKPTDTATATKDVQLNRRRAPPNESSARSQRRESRRLRGEPPEYGV